METQKKRDQKNVIVATLKSQNISTLLDFKSRPNIFTPVLSPEFPSHYRGAMGSR